MKYLTFEWWAGGCQDASVIDRYWSYFDSVTDQLPADAARLHREYTLHDSQLAALRIDPAAKTAVLELVGFDIDLDQRVGYRLEYFGLESAELSVVAQEPLGGPGGLGDLGYDEFEVVATGLTEHRMLFSTATQLTLKFRNVKLLTESLPALGQSWPVA